MVQFLDVGTCCVKERSCFSKVSELEGLVVTSKFYLIEFFTANSSYEVFLVRLIKKFFAYHASLAFKKHCLAFPGEKLHVSYAGTYGNPRTYLTLLHSFVFCLQNDRCAHVDLSH